MENIRALLLAAGRGVRLRPLTDMLPKCLMPIGSRPLLWYWLQTFNTLNIRDVLVNTHYLAEQVNAFLLRDQFAFWVKSVYEEELLGTAGTLRANANFFRGGVTLLVHADNWCQCDFGAFVHFHLYQRPINCPITMMTFDTDSPRSCGIVETDVRGVVKEFHEKVDNPPSLVANAAVYLLQPEVVEWIECHPDVSDFSTEVLPQFINRIATWHNGEVHRDIGTLAALQASQNDSVPSYYLSEPNDAWQNNYESSLIYKKIMNELSSKEKYND
jgi:mannose-1-phosphate guanylyltransferase